MAGLDELPNLWGDIDRLDVEPDDEVGLPDDPFQPPPPLDGGVGVGDDPSFPPVDEPPPSDDPGDGGGPRPGPRFLTELADVLRDAGVAVAVADGWEQRGKAWGEDGPQGVVLHHTADAGPVSKLDGSLQLVRNGNDKVPGPLSQLLLWRDGTVHVIAAGRANHAGVGSYPGVSSANKTLLGIEAANAGTGFDTWPAKQIDAYLATCAALCEHYGFGTNRLIAHREWAPKRKIDPKGPWERPLERRGSGTAVADWGDMEAWRGLVADRLGRVAIASSSPMLSLPTIVQIPPEDDDMTAARLYRDVQFENMWLIGAGPALHLSPELLAAYRQAGLPESVGNNPLTLKSLMFQSGISRDDLVKEQ